MAGWSGGFLFCVHAHKEKTEPSIDTPAPTRMRAYASEFPRSPFSGNPRSEKNPSRKLGEQRPILVTNAASEGLAKSLISRH